MDTAMRDLDMIQERTDDESPGRKATMLGLAALSTIALVFAMGVMLGDGGRDEAEASDPLAALTPAMAAATPVEEDTGEAAAEDTLAPGEVRFHEELTDSRPEVEAALAAAAAEQATLAAAMPADAPVAPTETAAAAPLLELATHPTEAAAPAPRDRVAAGHDGAFTLQVVSYRTREEADVFAEALRGRGHAAYVSRAELPGRGTYFRVRVGPFDSRVAADRYRTTFEREEALNSYVVDSARVAAASAAD